MRQLMQAYLAGGLSRRAFFERLVATGFSATGARAVIAASQETPVSASSPTTATGLEAICLWRRSRPRARNTSSRILAPMR